MLLGINILIPENTRIIWKEVLTLFKLSLTVCLSQIEKGSKMNSSKIGTHKLLVVGSNPLAANFIIISNPTKVIYKWLHLVCIIAILLKISLGAG